MDGEFLSILGTMVILFFDISIGYIAKKAHVMDKAIDKGLSKLILNTALPAMILGSVLTADSLPGSTEILITMGLSIVSFAIMTALAFLVTKLLGVRDGHRGVFRFMLTFGNVGFIGFPVLSAIFGPSTLIYGSIFNLPFNFLVFTMGVWFIAQDSGRGAKVKMGLKTFLTPANIACAIAIVLTLLNVHSVPIIGDAAETLGSFTTPGALLIIGSSLAGRPDAHRHHGGAVRDAGSHERHDAVLPIRRRLAHHGAGNLRHHRAVDHHDTDSRHGHRIEDEAREGEAARDIRARGIRVWEGEVVPPPLSGANGPPLVVRDGRALGSS